MSGPPPPGPPPPGWPPGPPPRPHGPPASPDVSPWLGILLGAFVIGPVVGTLVPIAVVAVLSSGSVDNGWTYFVLAVVVPLVVPVPLLFWKPTRPWGVGIIIGAALTAIVLAGSCAWIILEFENAHG